MTDTIRAFTGWPAIALTLGLLLGACSPSGEAGVGTRHDAKEYLMKTRSLTEPESTAIPPIDADAPQAVATATFGLG